MGLSKEQAYRILGLPNGASIYLVRSRYRKIANKYHPEKNPHRREYALKKFQRAVNAYVSLQIDPDDCDQMKMKHILTELYAINEEIMADEFTFSEDSDSEDDDIDGYTPTIPISYSNDQYTTTHNGPYADILQDFMIRSYMSGGRKSKPSVTLGSEKKSYVSKRAVEVASKNAEELMKTEEDEKKKNEKRKQKNKRKKEARKKKKDQKPRETTPPSPPTPEINSSIELVDSDTECENLQEALLDTGNEVDMSSAFFARVSAKLNTTPTPAAKPQLSPTINGTQVSSGLGSSTPSTVSTVSMHSVESVEETVSSKTTKETTNSKTKEPHVVVYKLQHRAPVKHSNNFQRTELPPRLAKLAQAQSKAGKYSKNGPRRYDNWTNDMGSDHYNGTYNGHKDNGIKTTDGIGFHGTTKGVAANGAGQKGAAVNVAKEREQVASSFNNGRANESKSSEYFDQDEQDVDNSLDQSRKLAGNKAAKDGRFNDAILHFTDAIDHFPFDHRYFGNRSFCYECIKDFKSSLEDAMEALKIKPDWSKGYFRKAKALAGLEKYDKAEECLEEAIKLDPEYTDAKEELTKLQSRRPRRTENVLKQKTDNIIQQDRRNGTVDSNTKSESVENNCQTLWVGNVDPAFVTEGTLIDIFSQCGTVEAVHVLTDRYCAFVKLGSSQEASLALSKLQKYTVGTCTLLLRYPDNPDYSPSLKRKTVNKKPNDGDECYFWRTTGCVFGPKCRFLHIPKNKGIDLNTVHQNRNGFLKYK